MMWRMNPERTAEAVTSLVRLRTVPVAWSTSTSSPPRSPPRSPGNSRSEADVMEFAEEIRAKVEATTQATPQARMATGACSRDERPHLLSARSSSPTQRSGWAISREHAPGCHPSLRRRLRRRLEPSPGSSSATSINVGLPIVECREIVEVTEEGDEVRSTWRRARFRNLTRDVTASAVPFPTSKWPHHRGRGPVALLHEKLTAPNGATNGGAGPSGPKARRWTSCMTERSYRIGWSRGDGIGPRWCRGAGVWRRWPR